MSITVQPLRANFTLAPNALMRDPDLSDRAVRMWLLLASVAGYQDVTYETLGMWSGASVATVKRALADLTESGYLTVIPQHDERGARIHNGYALTLPERATPIANLQQAQVTSDPTPQVTSDLSYKEVILTTNTEGAESAPTKTRRASRIPEGWTPSDTLQAWVRDNAPHVDLQAEVAKFVDYWAAKAGRDATKLDWDATFRNWVRNSAQFSRPQQRQQPATMAVQAQASDRRESMRRWLEDRGSSLAEYERRKNETGWMEGLKAMQVGR